MPLARTFRRTKMKEAPIDTRNKIWLKIKELEGCPRQRSGSTPPSKTNLTEWAIRGIMTQVRSIKIQTNSCVTSTTLGRRAQSKDSSRTSRPPRRWNLWKTSSQLWATCALQLTISRSPSRKNFLRNRCIRSTAASRNGSRALALYKATTPLIESRKSVWMLEVSQDSPQFS